MGIEQPIDDQVVFVRSPAKEGTCVVVDGMNAGIRVGFFGMALLADQKNGRVDLDGVNSRRARAQSRRDVVAGSGSDYRNVGQDRLGFIRKIVIAATVLGLVPGKISDVLIVMPGGSDESKPRI